MAALKRREAIFKIADGLGAPGEPGHDLSWGNEIAKDPNPSSDLEQKQPRGDESSKERLAQNEAEQGKTSLKRSGQPVHREHFHPLSSSKRKPARASGRRKSSKRDVVFQVLADIGRPLSPQEILVAAQAEAPTLGIATVYRNIRQLQDDGFIQAVELPGSAVRYELAGKLHHHHFHCNKCGRVYEIEGCPFGEHPHANLPAGFEVEDHAVIVYGRCAECSRH